MQTAKLKLWVAFFGSLILAGIFVWFGFKLLNLASNPTSSGELFLLGCACVLGAVFAVSTKKPSILGGVTLLAIGVYYFARATDWIERPILVKILGVASWVAAGLLVYIFYPNRRLKKGLESASTDQAT